MNITENAPLDKLNSFRVKNNTNKLIEIENIDDIQKLHRLEQMSTNDTFILGGGSNILFTRDFSGTIIHSKINTLSIDRETNDEVIFKCGSGINWDWFVDYCVSRNWGGIENLSDIPGNVGASPVQNIGAYGVEAKDSIIKVEAFDYSSGERYLLNNSECDFGYRDSMFKRNPTLFITHVWYRLSKHPVLNTQYGTIEKELEQYPDKTIKNLRKAVLKIRRSKLPSVDDIGSAGSFFKNPVISKEISNSIQSQYPEMPNYSAGNEKVKLSAAWLIDQSGLKGFRVGDVGTYPTQPLVIVNYGNATGNEIAEFARHVQKEVEMKFGIVLHPEVIYK